MEKLLFPFSILTFILLYYNDVKIDRYVKIPLVLLFLAILLAYIKPLHLTLYLVIYLCFIKK